MHVPSTTPNELAENIAQIAGSGFFDPQWYLEAYPDVAQSGIDALEHYARSGVFEGRSPGAKFDARWYLAQNPDVAAAGVAPFIHYLSDGRAEGRAPAPPEGLLETARRTIDDLARLEPELAAAEHFVDLRALPIMDGRPSRRLSDALEKLLGSLPRQFPYVVMVPWLIRGGADLVAVHATRALVARHGADAVLLVLTDSDQDEAKSWLPPGVEVRILSSFAADLDGYGRSYLVELLIQALRPHSVFQINSRACWDVIKRRGQALSRMTRLFAAAFCRDYAEDGRLVGYADTHFRDCLPFLERVYLDNATFAQELIARFGVPPSMQSKLQVAKQPIRTTAVPGAARTVKEPRSFTVLWAGRFAKQKNIDLLMEIVSLSQFSFVVWGWGEKVEHERLHSFASTVANLTVGGPYPSYASLPVQEYDALLYTSLWDGLPNVLIETAAAGVPIVASDVGGVKELVTPETGWLVEDHKNAAAYLRALDEIRTNPAEAGRRRDLMLELVTREHSWGSYLEKMSEMPSPLEDA
jgi:glycosyltransferase involved in cell wall biosynthesis